jgi:hypothetical protein
MIVEKFLGHRLVQTRPPRSHQSATQGVSGRGKRRLVQTAWRRNPCQIYKGAYLLCVLSRRRRNKLSF